MANLRLMSNNIWNCDSNKPAWEAQGLDCSAQARMPGIARVYAETRPDVIGLQEASHTMVDLLAHELYKLGLKYTVIWTRFTSILYRSDRFELVDADYLCYPETFEGYEGCFNDVRSKSCNLAVLRVKENGKCFVFANTHLWWKNRDPAAKSYQAGSGECRAYQLGLATDLINQYRAKHGGCPAVLLGDLNDNYSSPMMEEAFRRGYVHAHDVATEYANPFNGYHYCFPDGYRHYQPQPFERGIDHILVLGNDQLAVRRFDRYTPEYYDPLSDHYPAFADVEL
ncbi:MAG: hypothetical protein E7585_03405 [Ruminococcaceae bacterium]|nr:hypothetical protein [Oscillospiraceae bacterium]